MGFLDEVKSVAGEYKEDFDRETDPEERLLMRVGFAVMVVVVLAVLIGVLVLLAKLAIYLIPGFLVAGGVYWYVARNKGDKDKPDFRKN